MRKSLLLVAAGSIAGVALAAGATAAIDAAASSPTVTYSACLSAKGTLSRVGTVPPTCPGKSTVISWDSIGPQGPTGPIGPAGPTGPPGAAGPGLVAWAYVSAAGTVVSSSGNVTVANPDPGSYCIGVTGGTAKVAVASLDASENTGGTVQAGVYDASGCPADASDVYVITRPQDQDGGLPGGDHAFYVIIS